MFLQNDTPASLIAVPLLTLGGFLLLWGWVYQRLGWPFGGRAALVIGSFVPFHVSYAAPVEDAGPNVGGLI